MSSLCVSRMRPAERVFSRPVDTSVHALHEKLLQGSYGPLFFLTCPYWQVHCMASNPLGCAVELNIETALLVLTADLKTLTSLAGSTKKVHESWVFGVST